MQTQPYTDEVSVTGVNMFMVSITMHQNLVVKMLWLIKGTTAYHYGRYIRHILLLKISIIFCITYSRLLFIVEDIPFDLSSWDQYFKTVFAIKLWQDFDALF